MTTRKALGKGLGALIPEADSFSGISINESAIQYIAIDEISPNPYQPRKVFDDEKISELAESIKESGIIQPLLIRQQGEIYELVAGERRLRASALAGLEQVPVLVKDITDEQSLEIALVENIQRENLNPIEEAKAYKKLQETFSLTQQQLGKKVGKSRPTITNSLRLLNLPETVQEMLTQNTISMGHARALLSLPSTQKQKNLAEKIVKNNLTVREVEKLVKEILTPSLSKKKLIKKTPEIVTLEDQLRTVLGTKVNIKLDKKGKGNINIQFFSNDDLERILEILRKK